MHKLLFLTIAVLTLTGCAKIINELDGHATEGRHRTILCGVGCTACPGYEWFVDTKGKHPTREELYEFIWEEYALYKGRRKQFEEEFFEAVAACREDIESSGPGPSGNTLDHVYPYDGYFEGRIPYREDLR